MPIETSPDLQPLASPVPVLDPTTPLSGPDLLPVTPTGLAPASAREQSPGPVRWLRETLGLDRAVLFTIFARGWSSLAGIFTLALISRTLSPNEQGYYYTFYSLVALQIVFELGFSTVILQTASHEAAHLDFRPGGLISGPISAHNRLASVFQKAVRWYTGAALFMAAILLPAGILFFRRHTDPAHVVAWTLPWVLVVLASSCTFQIDPAFSFLEGCGFVPEVARVRLAQGVGGSLLGWSALLLHHGLFAPASIIFGQALVGGGFLVRKRLLLLPLLRRDPRPHHIHWGSEIWPFQWRIAISWLCGYFTFQFFTPVIFAARGGVEAGQLGMSLNVCSTLLAIAISWINTKASPFGQMIARRRFDELDRTFFRSLAQSLAAASIAFFSVWAVIVYLRQHGIPLGLRLLPPAPLALLLGATLLNIILFAEAIYIRAHKQEKFMVNSLVGAAYMIPAALFFGKHFGAYGICLSYFLGTSLVGIGYGTWTFQKWRKIWHAA